jgi:hypothetical protein
MKLTRSLHPSRAEAKNEWRYTCTVYIPSCLLQRKFTFTILPNQHVKSIEHLLRVFAFGQRSGDKEVRHWNEKRMEFILNCLLLFNSKSYYKHNDQRWQCWCVHTLLLWCVQIFSHNHFLLSMELLSTSQFMTRQSRSRRPPVLWTRSSAKAYCISNGTSEPLFTRQCKEQKWLGKGVNSLGRHFLKVLFKDTVKC